GEDQRARARSSHPTTPKSLTTWGMKNTFLSLGLLSSRTSVSCDPGRKAPPVFTGTVGMKPPGTLPRTLILLCRANRRKKSDPVMGTLPVFLRVTSCSIIRRAFFGIIPIWTLTLMTWAGDGTGLWMRSGRTDEGPEVLPARSVATAEKL